MPSAKIRQSLRTTGLVWDELFLAATNLSAACAQYKWVMPGSVFGEVILATGASLGAPLGILQNTPAAAATARVRVMGKSITAACLSACNLIPGTWVTVGSHGGVIQTASGPANARWAGSILNSASAAGFLGYGEVFLMGPSFSTCVQATS